MPTAPERDASEDPVAAIGAALLAERVRLYRASLASGLTGQMIVAVLVVWVLHGGVATSALLAWLALVMLAAAARVAVAWHGHRAAPRDGQPTPALLRRLRLTAAGQGLAWGMAGLLLFPAQDLQAQTFLAFVLAGIAAGSLTLTAFDLRVALAFAAFALAPLVGRSLAAGDNPQIAMAAMMVLFIAFLGVAAWRTQRHLVDAVVLREAETRRADALLRNQQRQQQLSEQLGQKTEALEVTLDSMEQGILSLGADGRTSFYNRRLVTLLDLPESFLAARPTMEEIARYQHEHGHYGPDLELVDEPARGALGRWIAGERPQFPPSYCRRTRAGLMLEIKTRYLPGGGLVRTFSDVTAYFDAQQRLQDSQAQAHKLALVAAHTDNAVTIVDAAGRIEWVNEGFTRLTGYALDEVVGRSPDELLRAPGADAEAARRMDEQLRRDKHCSGELLHQGKDGRAYWFAVDVQAIVDGSGQVLQYISIGRDVSERKAAEQALHAARDDAERASRAKSEFLSAMSHELRTPLNAILGFAQLLNSDPASPPTERQRGHLKQILLAGGHLLELISDVLDLARVEAGKQQISVEPVRVSTLFSECAALMRPLADEHGISIALASPADGECRVQADPTRLKQVLLNLLSNAIKYNRHGGSVQLGCRGEADRLRITVSDTGHGLDAEQRARLFTAFERLGAEGGPLPGAGVGLALSKSLVELMHGRIGIDSEVGRGSTFWIELPRAAAVLSTGPAAAAPAEPPPARAAAADGSARTVLYVEDNPVNVLLMEAALDLESGVRLITAPLPQLGLDLARTERPDLVLLDIQLPGMDGFEVLRRLRAHAATRDLSVVAVSANAMRSDLERAQAAGFDGYLTKPLDLAQLRDVVRRPPWAGHAVAAGGTGANASPDA